MTNFGTLLSKVGNGKDVYYLSEAQLKNLNYDTYFGEKNEQNED